MVQAALKKLGLKDKALTQWSDGQLLEFARALRSISKPIIIAANKTDVPVAKDNIERLKKEFPHYKIIPCSAESELALKEAAAHELIRYVPGNKSFEILKEGALSQKQMGALEFIKRFLGQWDSTGVQTCLNFAVFEQLGYLVAYPVEDASKLADKKKNILPDALLMPPGSTASNLAYAVHTDIGKSFIRGIDARTKKVIGREYKLKNADVIEIVAGR